MTTWSMYAGLRNGVFRHTSTLKRYPILSGNADVREVTVTEDPEGTYYGFIFTGDDAPSMIWRSKALFTVGFVEGPEAAEAKGRGRIVRLTIEERS